MKVNYQENKRRVVFLIFAMIMCILTLAYWFNCDRKANQQNFNIGFAGKVKRVEYDIKQYPIIIVDDSTYFIGSGYNTNHQIEIGDSLIKEKGSEVYTLIKRKNHEILSLQNKPIKAGAYAILIRLLLVITNSFNRLKK